MVQIYVITNDRYKDGGDEVTWEALQERCKQIDENVQLTKDVQGVYDTRKEEPELIAVPKEFVVQE